MDTWAEKYRPGKLKDIDGNWASVGGLLEYLKAFKADAKPAKADAKPAKSDAKPAKADAKSAVPIPDLESLGPALLVKGGVGVGKNTLVELAAQKVGFRCEYFDIEKVSAIPASSDAVQVARYCDSIKYSQGISARTGALVQYRSVLVIDKLDTYGGNKRESKVIKAILKHNSLPIRRASTASPGWACWAQSGVNLAATTGHLIVRSV